ncbi:MAG: pyridoxal phosphate-dependent aminotransferase [Thermoleophilia bacterium]
MPGLNSRLSFFTDSIIRRMTRINDSVGGINLSQGFPDFDPPPALLAAAARTAVEGPHQYAVTWGAPDFRAALAAKQSRHMGLPLDPDAHVVVTCGGTEAMMVAMMTTCEPGDRVIVFSPFYENYGADTILCGAEPLYVPMRPPDFRFDPDELRRAFERRPKALVLCNPSNPTGRVFSREELEVIAGLTCEFDTWVITDEVYEHIVYPPHRHTYMAALPGMFERTLSTGSLSKTYSITGWRLGYVLGPEAAVEGARKVHDFLTVGAAAPLQAAAVTALGFPDTYYEELAALYLGRRDLFLAHLDAAGLVYTKPEGAYYVLVDVSEFGVPDDLAFCEWMVREVGVAAVPGSCFFSEPVNHLVRFHFAKRDDTLVAAGERLMSLRDKARETWPGLR